MKGRKPFFLVFTFHNTKLFHVERSYRNNTNQQNLLNQFLQEHGVQLSEDVLGKLYDFADLVVNTKQFGNLISAKDSEKFLSRHIADSLMPYIYIVKKGNVILEQGKAAAIESMDPIGNSVSSRITNILLLNITIASCIGYITVTEQENYC